MTYLAPTTLNEALAALSAGAPSVIAGGTDWYPAQGNRPVRRDLLDITRIEGLRAITRTDSGWRIGAASTWSDIIRADLPRAFDGLKAAAREVGSVQIQNAGTIVGNLCNASPAADGVPPLLCLDAQVEIGSIFGIRTVPLEEFIMGVRQIDLAQGELVTAILIPKTTDTRRSGFVKLGARKYLVISIAMVAVSCEIENEVLRKARIAVGACSPVAQRLHALEAALEGKPPEAAAPLLQIAEFSPLAPIDDVRGSGVYRLDVLRALISRALKEAAYG